MQVTDHETADRLEVARIEMSERVGCWIQGRGKTWPVLFRRDGQPSAHPVHIAIPAPGPCRILVTDLEPGRWRLRSPGTGSAREVPVTEDLKAAWLEGAGGTWSLDRKE